MNRDYPSRPIVGLLAVVQRDDRFLLVRRANPPNQGSWGFPGGVQNLGETAIEGAERELAEETGVAADSGRIIGALVAVHFLWRSGEGEAADDAEAVGWFRLQDIESLAALPAVGQLMMTALAA